MINSEFQPFFDHKKGINLRGIKAIVKESGLKLECYKNVGGPTLKVYFVDPTKSKYDQEGVKSVYTNTGVAMIRYLDANCANR